MTARTTNNHNAIETLTSTAAFMGRSRIAYLSSKFFFNPPPGPVETASILALNPALSAELIRIANTVQHGAGIPVLNVEAATVRMGADRTRSLAIAHEIANVLAATLGDTIDVGEFWRRALVRGCLARALAMSADRRLAGQAFLVGCLQDIGEAILAAAEPTTYSTLRERGGGCPLQMAMLEWQTFNQNHIHAGLRILREWQLPKTIVDAVGRHHTNPPLTPATTTPIRLWQIVYIAGAIPIGPAAPTAAHLQFLRLLRAAFNIQKGAVSALIDQAADEYRDVEGLFTKYFTKPLSVIDLLSAASTLALDAASPSDIAPAPRSISVRDIAPMLESAAP
jgi:hypothetical protein